MKEFKTQEDFVRYLTSLEGEKPFNCDYLRVLPEAVFFNHHIPCHKEYQPGDLMCIKSMEKEQSALRDGLCDNFGSLKLEEEGLYIKCNWGKRWKIKVLE